MRTMTAPIGGRSALHVRAAAVKPHSAAAHSSPMRQQRASAPPRSPAASSPHAPQNPLQVAAVTAAAIGILACSATLAPGAALAELPAGKAAVTGPELLAIIKEDFLTRKYLVTGDLSPRVGEMGRGQYRNRATRITGWGRWSKLSCPSFLNR